MSYINKISLIFILLITGCTSFQNHQESEETRTMTVPSDRYSQVLKQMQQLETEGIINNVKILDPASKRVSISGPAKVLSCLEMPEGRWVQEHQECEFMNRTQCEALQGNFEECASACRHSQEAMVCIQMCVPVCHF